MQVDNDILQNDLNIASKLHRIKLLQFVDQLKVTSPASLFGCLSFVVVASVLLLFIVTVLLPFLRVVVVVVVVTVWRPSSSSAATFATLCLLH